MREIKISGIYFSSAITALALIGGLFAALAAENIFNIRPCELCLQQRWPYYIGAALALVLSTLAHYRRAPFRVLKLALIVLVGILAWSLYLAVQHSGVEWHWWASPTGCTSSGADVTISVKDLFGQLKNVQPIVACDAPAWKLFGIFSFANLNAILSLLLLIVNGCVLAGFELRKKKS
ncbi:MAG: disulfide bond formation protein B [Pseudomonadota bacterium]